MEALTYYLGSKFSMSVTSLVYPLIFLTGEVHTCAVFVSDWDHIWNIGAALGQFTAWKTSGLGWAGYSTGGNDSYGWNINPLMLGCS